MRNGIKLLEEHIYQTAILPRKLKTEDIYLQEITRKVIEWMGSKDRREGKEEWNRTFGGKRKIT